MHGCLNKTIFACIVLNKVFFVNCVLFLRRVLFILFHCKPVPVPVAFLLPVFENATPFGCRLFSSISLSLHFPYSGNREKRKAKRESRMKGIPAEGGKRRSLPYSLPSYSTSFAPLRPSLVTLCCLALLAALRTSF